jgi:hypothetical protein
VKPPGAIPPTWNRRLEGSCSSEACCACNKKQHILHHHEYSLELTFKIAQGQTKHKAYQVHGKPWLQSSHSSTRHIKLTFKHMGRLTFKYRDSSSLTFKHRGKGAFKHKHIQAQWQLIIHANSHSSTGARERSSINTFKHNGN